MFLLVVEMDQSLVQIQNQGVLSVWLDIRQDLFPWIWRWANIDWSIDFHDFLRRILPGWTKRRFLTRFNLEINFTLVQQVSWLFWRNFNCLMFSVLSRWLLVFFSLLSLLVWIMVFSQSLKYTLGIDFWSSLSFFSCFKSLQSVFWDLSHCRL